MAAPTEKLPANKSADKKNKQPLPPQDVIHEDSGPSVTETEKPQSDVSVDIDDASLEEPRDYVFEKKK